jgi:cytidylate kinase
MEDTMRTSTTHSNHDLATAAERQMRNWALELEMQKRVAEERERTRVRDLVHPYVAISREVGVDAGPLAAAVAHQCGWKALDHELLDYMAEHDHLSRLALEFVDEKAVSWFHEMFGKWLDEQLVSQAEYVGHLGKLLLLAAQHESTVFVGRGAQYMLPRECGLAVRIIAPLKQRVESVMRRRQCSERDAREFIETTDNGRKQFVQRYFHHDATDPELYDIVLNLAHIPREEAVDLIATEAQRHAERVLAASGRMSGLRQIHRPNESPRTS